jgi:hypothetical protein
MKEEFRKMAGNFHQDFLLPPDTLEDSTKFVLCNLTPEELKRLKAYLSEIVSNRYSDEQLQNLWAETSAEVGFPEGLRMVLTMVRDHIK